MCIKCTTAIPSDTSTCVPPCFGVVAKECRVVKYPRLPRLKIGALLAALIKKGGVRPNLGGVSLDGSLRNLLFLVMPRGDEVSIRGEKLYRLEVSRQVVVR